MPPARVPSNSAGCWERTVTSPYVGNAATFLIETLFGLYILVVMLRLLFQLVRADFYNPLSQFVVKATNPPLRHLRRFIPGFRGIDLASVTLLVALQLIELSLVSLVLGVAPHPVGLVILSLAQLLQLAIYVFMFSIIIQVVISWVNPGAYNPVVSLLHSLNEPLLAPARRMIPPMSGLDLSPLVVIVGLQLALLLLVAPISDLGRWLL